MTCDEIRDKLLTLPDPRRPTTDLRAHLTGCPACAALQAAAAGIESTVAVLPVPSSEGAKAAFLARLAEPEPVITRMPTLPRRRGLPDWTGRVKWQHAAGLAAGVLVAVGGWSITRGPDRPDVAAAAPRHPLLQKFVRYDVKLTKAGSAADRMAIWTGFADDLRKELAGVCQVAKERDMEALSDMFDKAVQGGVVAQAGKLPEFMDAKDRLARLNEASNALAAAEMDIARLKTEARQQAQPALGQMARTAKAGKEKLEKLARGEKV
jgi:hypothetical protein